MDIILLIIIAAALAYALGHRLGTRRGRLQSRLKEYRRGYQAGHDHARRENYKIFNGDDGSPSGGRMDTGVRRGHGFVP